MYLMDLTPNFIVTLNQIVCLSVMNGDRTYLLGASSHFNESECDWQYVFQSFNDMNSTNSKRGPILNRNRSPLVWVDP